MPIEVTPEPAPVLHSVSLIEQRTYGTTAYPTLQRIYVDGQGAEVKREADAPQVHLNLAEWPDLAAAHQAYIDLLEMAAAFQLGYIANPGQQHTPESPVEVTDAPLG